MARIQQSIEVNVPVQTAYRQLTRFEDYPRFMHDIEAVEQLDDTRLHWSSRIADQHLEWDAEITELLPDRSIAWRYISGPQTSGKVEVQPAGQQSARVTLTMEYDPAQLPWAPANDPESAIAQRIGQELASFKAYIETRGSEAGAAHPDVAGTRAIRRERDVQGKTQGDELESAVRMAAGQPAGKTGGAGGDQASPPQAEQTTQSAASLSQAAADEADNGRFSVAEEQNFDQQSDQARRVGKMPSDLPGVNPVDAVAQSMKPDKK